jgi:23S rRNA (uracil1939-C5)-methyltransferase
MEELKVESLDQEGRGVARRDGKAIFIEGALPGEVVTYSSYRKKPSYEIATLGAVIKESAARVEPRCPHFSVCGGCSMQHFDARAQVAVKQRVLEDSLWHIGRVRPESMLPAIYGAAWGYRHRARLTVRFVPKKGGALVGFHEKKSSYVAAMDSCEVMPPRISALIRPLRDLVGALSIRSRLPQIEVAVGEGMDVLVSASWIHCCRRIRSCCRILRPGTTSGFISSPVVPRPRLPCRRRTRRISTTRYRISTSPSASPRLTSPR